MSSLEFFILICPLLIGYTYFLYPFGISLLSRYVQVRSSDRINVNNYAPSVAILCAMYNEEDVAVEKVNNFRALRYSNVHMYIGSDGSTDATDEIIDNFSDDKDITVFSYPRRGKVHVLNDLISTASEDIFVFTDANSMYIPDALEKLLLHFKNPKVGAVCGCLKLIDTGADSGEGFYWRYETMIKKAESVFGYVVGGNGAIYGVRKKLLKRLPTNTINDDFTISMRVIEQGYSMTFAEDAIATEEVAGGDAAEFRRHIRDSAGHYRALVHLVALLNPLFPKRFFFYVSHRVIRWFVPHLMLVSLLLPMLNLSLLLSQISIVTQAVFYSLALAGQLSGTKLKIFYLPQYFVYINMAMFVGFTKNIFGFQKVTWDRSQR